jgi:hypothetical protein
MASVAQIVIEVNDAGAVTSLKKINDEAAKLGPTLQPIQRISEQTFNNIETGALRARESAALLGEEFGVKIPRALRGTIAEAAGIGKIFTAAFTGLAVVGFIEIAKTAGEKISEVIAEMLGWGEATKKAMEAQGELNKVFIEANDHIEKLREAYRLIGLQGLPLVSEKQSIANEKFDEAKKKVADLTAELARLRKTASDASSVVSLTGLQIPPPGSMSFDAARKALAEAKPKMEQLGVELAKAQAGVMDLGQATKNAGKEFSTTFSKERADGVREFGTAVQQALTKLQEMQSGPAKSGADPEAQIGIELRAKQEELAKILSLYGEDETVRREVAAASVAVEKEARDKRIKLLTDEAEAKLKIWHEEDAEEIRAAHEHAEKIRRMEDETINVEREAAIASAPPWERANARILADYQARMDKIKEMEATGDLDSEHAARQAAAAWTVAFSEMRDKLAGDLETLFDNVTSGNIGKWFLQQFKHMVFQMVATWVLGMQQMRGASQQQMGSGGGILGAIFGGIFGGGGGGIFGGAASGGPGGTPPFLGGLLGPGGNGDFGGEASGAGGAGLGSGLFGALGLSAGAGAGLGTALPSGAGAVGGGVLSNLFKLFSGQGGISPFALTVLGGTLLASNFGKGGILHALGGAAGGALTGLMVGGPIGALIGGIVGFFSGLFQHSTKSARLAIEADIKAKSKTIEDSYNLFQSDWTSSRDALEQLRQAGVDALKQAGVKDINRSRVGHVDQWIDKAENEIDATQAERNRRAALVFGPPEFRVGGFVGSGLGHSAPAWFAGTALHFASGGAVPALLHEGEYVFRPEAVQRIGRGKLDSMNSGGGGGDVHIHIHALDVKDFEGFLSSGGADKIQRSIRRGRYEGRW